MADKCAMCGEEHPAANVHETDPEDPRLEPWKTLIAASEVYPTGSHLLLIPLDPSNSRGALLITGMSDPLQQVVLMTQVLTSILDENGNKVGAQAIYETAKNFVDTVQEIRREARARKN